MVVTFPSLGWWSYLGVAGLVGASLWSFFLGRLPGNCVVEMAREAHWHERFGSPAERLAIGTLVAPTLYGLSGSVTTFTNRWFLEAARIIAGPPMSIFSMQSS